MLTYTDNENKNNNGFIFGFILGIGAALLFNTKKGRKILKTLIDQGIDRIGDWEGTVKEIIEEDDDFVKGGDYISQSSSYEPEISSVVKHSEAESGISDNFSIPVSSESRVKKATRRFFKGIKRKG